MLQIKSIDKLFRHRGRDWLLFCVSIRCGSGAVFPLATWGSCDTACAWQAMACNHTAMETMAADTYVVRRDVHQTRV